MKRKGRQHLPKAGTKPDQERVLHQSRSDLVNFGRHRRLSRPAQVTVLVVAIVVVVVLVAFLALT